jgi:hypothetical protein
MSPPFFLESAAPTYSFTMTIPDTQRTPAAREEDAEAASNEVARPITVPSQVEIVDPTQCLCFPHGFYSSIPAILSTFGWFARLSQDGCDYSRLTGPIVGKFILFIMPEY